MNLEFWYLYVVVCLSGSLGVKLNVFNHWHVHIFDTYYHGWLSLFSIQPSKSKPPVQTPKTALSKFRLWKDIWATDRSNSIPRRPRNLPLWYQARKYHLQLVSTMCNNYDNFYVTHRIMPPELAYKVCNVPTYSDGLAFQNMANTNVAFILISGNPNNQGWLILVEQLNRHLTNILLEQHCIKL